MTALNLQPLLEAARRAKAADDTWAEATGHGRITLRLGTARIKAAHALEELANPAAIIAICEELERLRAESTAPATPGQANGMAGWSALRNLFVTYAERWAAADQYEVCSAIADEAAREFEALAALSPAVTGEG